MANTTPNYNLIKPLGTEKYDVAVPNANMDNIDLQLKNLEDTKVDKEVGKGLSDENYTLLEKNKLAGIEENATADMTALEIKAEYESNPDTNAYTDAEKAKVANLPADTIAQLAETEQRIDQIITTPVIVGLKGKNMFNKEAVTLDKYVDYTTGNLVTATDWSVSDYIEINPTTSYMISGSSGQCAYYDVNKVYVSGKVNSILNNIPPTAKYLRMSVQKVNLDITQLEVGTVPTAYEPYGNKLKPDTVEEAMLKAKSVTNVKLGDESVNTRVLGKESVTLEKLASRSVDETKLTKTFAYGQIGKNLFDKSKVVTGYYVDYTTGNLVSNAEYSVSTYIEISSTNPYYVSGTTGGQVAYYDANKVFVLGKANQILNNIPLTAKYMRVSIKITELNTAQIEIGAVPTVYEAYKHIINPDDISRTKQFNLVKSSTLTVKPDGSGDFTNPVAAIAYVNSRKDMSWFNQYDIEVYEGIYDVISYFDPVAITNLTTRGLEIPDFVNVIGVGSRENIVFKGELPLSSTDQQVLTISTLNYEKGGRLENITVTAKNMRYAVHADGNESYKDYKGKIKNCVFIHFGNDIGYSWQSTSAWGSGIHSGSERIFEDCVFITHKDAFPFSVHSNVNFTRASLNKLINCDFINMVGDSAFNANSLGSGAINKVTLIGCKLNGKLIVKRSGSGVDNFLVDGYGNQVVPHDFVDSDGSLRDYIDFTDEVKHLANKDTATITKGSLVKAEGFNGVKKFASTDKVVLFEGIALEDITVGGFGAIKFKGYVLLSDVGLTANLGDKIGITNGALAVVTTGDYIGIVDKVGYLKLI